MACGGEGQVAQAVHQVQVVPHVVQEAGADPGLELLLGGVDAEHEGVFAHLQGDGAAVVALLEQLAALAGAEVDPDVAAQRDGGEQAHVGRAVEVALLAGARARAAQRAHQQQQRRTGPLRRSAPLARIPPRGGNHGNA